MTPARPSRVLAFAGTRPEVLKLAPVLAEAARPGSRLTVDLVLSGQHGDLARRAAADVGAQPFAELPELDGSLGLPERLAETLSRLSSVLRRERPRGALVQGDTTTTLAAALAAFHLGLPVFHVEAGLRTNAAHRPFPEEMNRRLVTRLSSLHFAPTEQARDRLRVEGVPPDSIHVTGNTGVDALLSFGEGGAAEADALLAGLRADRPKLLVTLHRRENADHAAEIARAVAAAAARLDVDVVWIRHPNTTSRAAEAALGDGVRFVDPQGYRAFVALLSRMRVVLTDSGGVQEEAPLVGVPAVVLRRETDRPEAVATGRAVVAGDDAGAILAACERFLAAERPERAERTGPFGDGRAAPRIVEAVVHFFDVADGGRGGV